MLQSEKELAYRSDSFSEKAGKLCFAAKTACVIVHRIRRSSGTEARETVAGSH